MPRSSSKKRASTSRKGDAPVSPPLNPLLTGMPALDSIISVEDVKVGSKVYRIIETNEVDEYEKLKLPKKKRSRKR